MDAAAGLATGLLAAAAALLLAAGALDEPAAAAEGLALGAEGDAGVLAGAAVEPPQAARTRLPPAARPRASNRLRLNMKPDSMKQQS